MEFYEKTEERERVRKELENLLKLGYNILYIDSKRNMILYKDSYYHSSVKKN